MKVNVIKKIKLINETKKKYIKSTMKMLNINKFNNTCNTFGMFTVYICFLNKMLNMRNILSWTITVICLLYSNVQYFCSASIFLIK